MPTPTPIKPQPSTLPNAAERRRDNRYLLVADVTMQGDNNFYVGISSNISEGGMFIATHHRLPIGTQVLLTFTLPLIETSIHVQGVVEWVRDPRATMDWGGNFGGDVAGVKPGMGIRFEGLAPEARRAITTFISIRQPELFE